ncbi:MAG: FAD-dependent oxidoreductase [Alphaproteobacteria bacterium]|nr:FAD-dependent oxidoreductase [Alphaproteobacteria bacterium]
MAEVSYGAWDDAVFDNRPGSPASGQNSPVELVDLEQFDPHNRIRAFFGDRGFFVFDPSVSLVDALWRQMAEAAAQSCGKCTPCRMGTVLVRDALDALRKGKPSALSLDAIKVLAEQMTATSMCGVGRTCARSLLAVFRHFRDQVEAELRRGAQAEQHGMAYMTAPCIQACPSRVNVPRYIDYIRDGMPAYALGVILQKYPMAATCGRVCVRFCEMACRRKLVDEAVGIKTLKRYVADLQTGNQALGFGRDLIANPLSLNMRVAVVGAGPAGVSCAYHLLLRGYSVDIFEALEEAGGMAAIGIPSYRLPKDVLRNETDIITALGGHFLFGQRLGRDFTIDDLQARGYQAIFLAIGCQEGAQLGVEGEDPTLQGYKSGIRFLLEVHEYVAGTHTGALEGDVIVVGGGNVAMDCARSALRMGAARVHVVYRRTREDMPADHEEVDAAIAEGIEFHFLTNPLRIIAEDGRITGVEVTTMRPTAAVGRGRRNVEPVPGTGRVLPCTTLIAAIGQQIEKGTLLTEDGIKLDRWNCVEVTTEDLSTSRKGVFAGGDCASGPSTLIHAMANGLKAARSIDGWIRDGRALFEPRARMRAILNHNKMIVTDAVEEPVKPQYRVHHPELDPDTRKQMFEEVEQTISAEQAYHEARRCLRCYRIYSVITERKIANGA